MRARTVAAVRGGAKGRNGASGGCGKCAEEQRGKMGLGVVAGSARRRKVG